MSQNMCAGSPLALKAKCAKHPGVTHVDDRGPGRRDAVSELLFTLLIEAANLDPNPAVMAGAGREIVARRQALEQNSQIAKGRRADFDAETWCRGTPAPAGAGRPAPEIQ